MPLLTYAALASTLRGTSCEHGNSFIKLRGARRSNVLMSQYGKVRQRKYCSCKQIFFNNTTIDKGNTLWYNTNDVADAYCAVKGSTYSLLTAGLQIATIYNRISIAADRAEAAATETMTCIERKAAVSADRAHDAYLTANVNMQYMMDAIKHFRNISADILNAVSSYESVSGESDAPTLSASYETILSRISAETSETIISDIADVSRDEEYTTLFKSIYDDLVSDKSCVEIAKRVVPLVLYQLSRLGDKAEVCHDRACTASNAARRVIERYGNDAAAYILDSLLNTSGYPDDAADADNAGDADDACDTPECSICLISLEEVNDVVTPCAHRFCESCLEQWLLKHSTCPMCRREI